MRENLQLSLTQKKQVAMLYLFSSTEYIGELDLLVNKLMHFVDTVLSTAEREYRDQVLVDPQWGSRNTAGNWGSYAWPFLIDFKKSLLVDIANRENDHYQVTGTTQFMRGIDEYSLQWTTPAEQKEFDEQVRRIDHHGMFINQTMRKDTVGSAWDDYDFAMAWQEHRCRYPRLPRFRVHTDVEGVTGSVPPRTGVYLPQDDIHGAPQFAWCGVVKNRRNGKLLECTTFNDIGLSALKVLGRRDLWFEKQKMFAFASLPQYTKRFQEKLRIGEKIYPELGPSAVAQSAFTSRPCKWYFVELIEGEYEEYDDNTIPGVIDDRLRVEAGNPCPRAGYYLTPANANSRRYFEQGEIMPTVKSELWGTIWQSAD